MDLNFQNNSKLNQQIFTIHEKQSCCPTNKEGGMGKGEGEGEREGGRGYHKTLSSITTV